MKHDWMLSAPDIELPADALVHIRAALAKRDARVLPSDVPVWLFLRWLAEQGLLLHGSPRGDLEMLRAPRKDYAQPDAFSNRAGVYAASDALWAMMYALRGPNAAGQMDMCLCLQTPDGWSNPRYYYALGTDGGAFGEPRDLLRPGWVYVLGSATFEPSPPYEHGSFGWVKEMHWVSSNPVAPLMTVAVEPGDFPLPVATYDIADIKARSEDDPWGFPWIRA